MNANLSMLLNTPDEEKRVLKSNIFSNLRVAMPGIIEEFDPVNQTANVKPALRQKVIQKDMTYSFTELPTLPDVQVILPRCNNFVLTMPIKKGDEGILIFLDMCYDNFWEFGGVQNPAEYRSHDLSDAIFIPSIFSNPKNIKNYSSDSTQLRSVDGKSYIEFKDEEINIVGKVKINGNEYSSHTHKLGDNYTSSPE